MNLLFMHTSTKVKEDEKGNIYIDGSYSKDVLERYLKISNQLTVVFIKEDKIYSEEYARENFELFNNEKIKLIEYIDTKKSIKDFLSIRKRKENNRIIKNAVKHNDKIIIRLPCSGGYIAAKYAKKYNKKYLIEVVGCIFDALWNYNIKGKILSFFKFMQMRKAVKKADYAVYVTQEFLQKRYPCKNYSIGCTDVDIKEIEEKNLIKRINKIEKMENTKKLSIATIGAIDVKYKGQVYVIKAIAKLKKMGYDIKYYIIGNGNPKYLQSKAEQLKVNENIIFTGAVPHKQIFNYLDDIDLYIQPSKLEGLCRAIIEAMSRACPVVASKVGENPELIKNEKYIFKKGKDKEIVKIIKNINKEDLKIMAKENFENSKSYVNDKIENKRKEIYEKYTQEK